MTSNAQPVVTSNWSDWELIRQDYNLRLSLVANDWSEEHLRAWNGVFAEGRKRGNAGYYARALVEMEIADCEKRAEWSYRTCCEICEIQGRTKDRRFYRTVFDWCLQQLFAVREACFTSALELHNKRTRATAPHNLSTIGGHMKRQMGKLRARWATILEIATRDAENEQRLNRKREYEQKISSMQNDQKQILIAKLARPREPLSPSNDHSEAGALSSWFTWKELEIKFREIQASSTPRENLYALFTRTEWNSGAIGEEWSLGGVLALQKEFEYLGAIAARKLGHVPGEEVFKEWLGRVRKWMHQTGLDKDTNFVWSPTGSLSEGVVSGTTQSMRSEKIAELSAKFCMSLIAGGTPELSGSQQSEEPGVAEGTTKTRPVKRRARKTKQQVRRTAIIFGAIQLKLKGQKYCSVLDDRRLRPSSDWIEDGCPPAYSQAYKNAKWRKRIQDEKSRLRKQYDQASDREREAIIQGDDVTRRTRQ